MLGITISIEQIETILGIIILCVQIALILYKGIFAIVKKVKNKDYSGIKEDIETMKDELEEVQKEKVTKKK